MLVIEANITGVPFPSLSWKKDNSEVDKTRIKLTTNDVTNLATLTAESSVRI